MRLMKVFLAGLSALTLGLSVAAQAQTEDRPTKLTVEQQEERQERLKDRLETKDCFGHVHGLDRDALDEKNLGWVRSGDKSARHKCEKLLAMYANTSRKLHKMGVSTEAPTKIYKKISDTIEQAERIAANRRRDAAKYDPEESAGAKNLRDNAVRQAKRYETQVELYEHVRQNFCRRSGGIWPELC